MKLNVPPFLGSYTQLPPEGIERECSVVSLQIHVEHAISRIKNFAILKGKFPLSMIRLLNKVVASCLCLACKLTTSPCSTPMKASDEEINEYFEEDSDIMDHESDVE